MNYISVLGLSKTYGIRTLFKEVDFHVNEGDQIAFVAKNGSGKSTLLKILAGKETSDSGEVIVNKDVKVILFEQNDDFNESLTAEDYIFNHSNPILNIVNQYEKILTNEPENPKLLDLIEQMDQHDAWKVESIIQEIISKLKIDFLNQKIGKLSGGQRKRISLAKFLIDIILDSGHSLLILDEPTNHLDIEMVEWLEYFLNKENKTMILVTHDRYFLDAICTKIFELEDQRMYVHSGDYETYVTNKALRIENQNAQIDKAKNLYRKELEWMRRQPKARTTKSKSRIDDFHETEEKANRKITDEKVALHMEMTRLGNKIINFEKVCKRYDEKIILDTFSYSFLKGAKIGIVGKNGVGKTTFLKILEGIEEADSGEIERGETLKFGHFKQDGITYKENQRTIEFVQDIAEFFPLANGKTMSAGQFLELFLFSPEQQYTPISKLSGGEKKRLQLLSILFKNPNFLILDEPTNDLDLPTLTVLENFLKEFQGCLLIVSHDRYFMDKVVDELLVFEGEGIIQPYIGNYTSFFHQEKENKSTKEEVKVVVKESKPKEEKKETIRKLNFNEKRELELIDKEIPKLELKKEVLSQKISDANLDYEAIQKLGKELEEVIQEIEEKELRWLELNELES